MNVKPKSEGGKVIDARDRFARRAAGLPQPIFNPFAPEEPEDWELNSIHSVAAVHREPLRNKCRHLHEAGEEMCLEFSALKNNDFFWEMLDYMAHAPEEYFSDYRQEDRYKYNDPELHAAAQRHFFNHDSCGYKSKVLCGYWASLESSFQEAENARRKAGKDVSRQTIMIIQVRTLFIDMLTFAYRKYLRDQRRGQDFPDAG